MAKKADLGSKGLISLAMNDNKQVKITFFMIVTDPDRANAHISLHLKEEERMYGKKKIS
jgi:hypothetical protein